MGLCGRFVRRINRRIQLSASLRVCRHLVSVSLNHPIVSFTFDDVPRSACLGARILEEHDAKGTFYISSGLAGTPSKLGEYFHMEDLLTLVHHGHEVACHTMSHQLAVDIPYRAFERDVLSNLETLSEVLDGYRVRNFAFPAGAISPRTKAALSRHFRSLRVTGGHKPLTGRIDLNQLPGVPVFSQYHNEDYVRELITLNARIKGWLLLYTHDISESPSPFGCKPGLFHYAVAFAKSSSRILSVDGALDVLSPPVG